jgi:hypothetical protein
VVYAYNSSYLRGRYCNLRPAWAKSSWDVISINKIGRGGTHLPSQLHREHKSQHCGPCQPGHKHEERTKETRSEAQVEECLPVMSSNLSTTRKKKSIKVYNTHKGKETIEYS